MSVTWTTPAGPLLTCTATSSVNVSITATNASNYSLISGALPNGIELSTLGNILGISPEVDGITTSTFVVRATDGNIVRDRTFNITVLNNPILWSTTGFSINGSTLTKLLINENYVEIPIDANLVLPTRYSLNEFVGPLPYGLKLDSSGKIRGIPRLILSPGEVKEFLVDIIASDGINEYTQSFVFNIIDSNSFIATNTNFIIDGTTATIGISDLGSTSSLVLSSLQPPEFLVSVNLGTVLANERQYISVQAYDQYPEKGPLTYTTVNTLPPNLLLDPQLGYLYGHLSAQSDFSHLYNFNIQAMKTDFQNNIDITTTCTFQLTVVNQYYENVIWPSSNLGSLAEGITSELTIAANQKDNTWNLKYYMMPGNHLPNGLSLSTNTGNIIGNATTSGNFTFTVAASTATYNPSNLTNPILPYPVSFNTFNVQVTPVTTDYTSIWVKPFLNTTQRQEWDTFINDTTIFLPDVLYRADDPSFGLQDELKIFLEFGIEKTNSSTYANALHHNLYEKRFTFGSIKSAIARDARGNHVYDAVYVDIVDHLDGASMPITVNGLTYYPGSIDGIRDSLESIILGNGSNIGVDGKHLPRFMRTVASNQEYGYIKVAVLCYTLPGQSNKILNRIRGSHYNLNNLNFFIDRLVVKQSLDNTNTSFIVFNTQPIG
jgi:hypothetical protein